MSCRSSGTFSRVTCQSSDRGPRRSTSKTASKKRMRRYWRISLVFSGRAKSSSGARVPFTPDTPIPKNFTVEVLFPLKARIDLAYFPERNLFRDLAWIVRGTLAVLGWSPLVRQGLNLVEEANDWRREGRAGTLGLPAPILTPSAVGAGSLRTTGAGSPTQTPPVSIPLSRVADGHRGEEFRLQADWFQTSD